MKRTPLTTAELCQAIEIYLRQAYEDGTVPPNVLAKTPAPAIPLASSLESGLFELPLRKDDQGRGKYALRLGNTQYPHMKLVLTPCPTDERWLLSADTHDRHFEIDPALPGVKEFLELREFNTALKQRVELAWAEAGLPTFAEYLKEEVATALQEQDGRDEQSTEG